MRKGISFIFLNYIRALNGINEVLHFEETKETSQSDETILAEFLKKTAFWQREWNLPTDLYPPARDDAESGRDFIDHLIHSTANDAAGNEGNELHQPLLREASEAEPPHAGET